jgi:peptide deformylase
MGRFGILPTGHPILRLKADPVPERLFNSPELHNLIEQMRIAMQRAPGVGLAAPQIGIPLQVIVLEDKESLMALNTEAERKARGRKPVDFQAWINPTMEALSDEQVEHFEGCLSVPGFEARVKRYRRIKIEGRDETGARKEPAELSNWAARIVQHEIDHLAGTLYIDRMDPKTFSAFPAREVQEHTDLLASLNLT